MPELKQLELFNETYDFDKMKALSFKDSKELPIYNWYPYVEGFSASWLRKELDTLSHLDVVYDPFGGSGTTSLECVNRNISSYYSEVNPFMRFVAETKCNASRLAKQNLNQTDEIFKSFLRYVKSEQFITDSSNMTLVEYESAFPGREFFEEEHIKQLLTARQKVVEIDCESYIKDLLILSITSIAVASSNMTRRADLRKRKPNEYKDRIVNIPVALCKKVNVIFNDLKFVSTGEATVTNLNRDARERSTLAEGSIDLAITSPPYLNGTNYIRNTKIEIWLAGFIQHERELKDLRNQMVCGGITDATKSRLENLLLFPNVEVIAELLEEDAYDKRIPLMTRSYFSDMYKVLSNIYYLLKPNGKFVMDIGDSKFGNVHIPTDRLLIELARNIGFEVEYIDKLARRYSRDKTELTQVAIHFRK